MNARTSLSRHNQPLQPLRPSYLKSGSAYVPRREPKRSSPRPAEGSLRRQEHTRRIATPKASQSAWLEPTEQDRLLRQRSLTEAHRGNHQTALEGLNLLVERNPHSAIDYNNRGLVYFQSGQFAAALADYNHAIKLNARLASAYNNRANYYAAKGRLAEAIADYETAIDLDPTNVRAWINQGVTFRELEMYSQAIENLDHALQITQFLSTGTSTAILEGHIYGARGRTHHLAGDWNCAIADYHRALEKLNYLETIEVSLSSYRLQSQVENWLTQLMSSSSELMNDE